jgi:hypothetical protein
LRGSFFRGSLFAGGALVVLPAAPAAAQIPSEARIDSIAEPCPAVDAAHDRELTRYLALEYPDSAVGGVARGFAWVLKNCNDRRVLRWFQDHVRAEVGQRRRVASAYLALLEPIPMADSIAALQAVFLSELVREGYARGRDETEPLPGRDLQSYLLEGLKRTGADEELTRLYFELVGTGQLDPVFGEGRLLGHLAARRGDAFLGEYADVIREKPYILNNVDTLFYVNQILYGRPVTPGSGAEKLTRTLSDLGRAVRR